MTIDTKINNKNEKKFEEQNNLSLQTQEVHLKLYADIKTQLDALDKKALDLLYQGHQLAGKEAQGLISELRDLNRWYFEEKRITSAYYKSKAFDFINKARPRLCQQRGYKELLGNLILLILVIPCIVNKVVNNHYLFFQKPNCAEQLNQLNQTVSQLSL